MKKIVLGFVMGVAAAGSGVAWAQNTSRVDTNGTLFGYIVQKDGQEVCRDPSVWNQFRGPESYIVCD